VGGFVPMLQPIVYEALDMKACGVNIVYMATTAVGYFLFAVMLDYLLANPWVRKKFVLSAKPVATSASSGVDGLPDEDSDVAEERRRVAAATDSQDVLALRVRRWHWLHWCRLMFDV
jgi:hypothetical protein